MPALPASTYNYHHMVWFALRRFSALPLPDGYSLPVAPLPRYTHLLVRYTAWFLPVRSSPIFAHQLLRLVPSVRWRCYLYLGS